MVVRRSSSTTVAVLRLRHEQPGGVGADVDDGDGHVSPALEDALHRPRQHRAVAPTTTGPLHQLGMRGHERYRLVVLGLRSAR